MQLVTRRRVTDALSSRVRRWTSILRLLAHAGGWVVSGAILLNLALGLLPIGFIVAMSVLLQRLPAAAADATGSGWGTLTAPLIFAVLTFVLLQVLVPFQTAVGQLVTWRVDAYCVRLLMDAALVDAPVGALEDQEELDRLSRAREAFGRNVPAPGDAAAGAVALIARYGQLFGSIVLLAFALSPLAAAVIAVTALAIRAGQRGSLSRFGGLLKSLYPTWRRAIYVRTVASGAELAKEIRLRSDRLDPRPVPRPLPRISARDVEGAAPDLAAAVPRLRRDRHRRRLGRVRDARPRRSLGRAQPVPASLAIQAILIPMRFGVFFPESDVPTQYGLQAYEAINEFRELARDHPGLPMLGTVSAAGLPVREIRFEGVTFRYSPDGPAILDDLDLVLIAGQSTALVGLNGAGKTTLVKLLARLYDPTSGRITVDGQDLRDIDLRQWHAGMAVLFQDFIRFELTAAENIDMPGGRDPADLVPLREAATRAGALEFIESLPAGFASPMSSRYAGGTDLSGGQWQRLALARALYKVARGASVMILDEPTAQLDVLAEVDFFDRFLDITQGLTTLIISHRFSTVRRADQIVVLAHGRVLERGAHEELMSAGGTYAELFRLQANRFTDALIGGDGTEADA